MTTSFVSCNIKIRKIYFTSGNQPECVSGVSMIYDKHFIYSQHSMLFQVHEDYERWGFKSIKILKGSKFSKVESLKLLSQGNNILFPGFQQKVGYFPGLLKRWNLGDTLSVNSSPFVNKISFVPNEDDDDIGASFCAYFLNPLTGVQEWLPICIMTAKSEINHVKVYKT